ncbi:LCP family protein [Clostridium thermosuccinogenes]|jgi:LCP family protein required for cell wall assembly|uniref:LCP family protein n=1 Tax=Clostridium thermosuccinogenes TaxID=84032 RepID=UPI000CCBDD21|nr:LCP family protein [Pseudoclostridium thermosuccinogenes]PNT92936.1 hypothetical protein CDQ83_05125 [Pseudoclostridium thermosuccinogenes]
MKTRRYIFLVCAFIITGFFIEGIYALSIINKTMGNQDSGKDNPLRNEQVKYERNQHSETVRKNTDSNTGIPFFMPQKGDTLDPGPAVYDHVNVLILGLDEYGERSDVIILANLNTDNGNLNLLSVARDTRVRARGKYTKINALIGMGGERMIMDKVEEITGLSIPYYITLDFKGFKKVIDVLGGVEMEVPFDMDYDDPQQNLHIHLKKGRQVLDGEKAIQFVRYRKGNRKGVGYINGDIDRISAQQQLIKALIAQKAKIKYLSKIDDIFLILKDYVKTNIEISDVNYYLDGLVKIRYEKTKTFTLPGESVYTNKTWYYIYDRQKTRELINGYFF